MSMTVAKAKYVKERRGIMHKKEIIFKGDKG
jgi:hypothetical protein